MPFFYAPDEINPAPDWWALTLQRWESLLEEAVATTEIEVSCVNPLAFQMKGFVPVVRDVACIQIRVQVPEGTGDVQVRVVRDAPGAANKRNGFWLERTCWSLRTTQSPHKTPVKYVVEAIGHGAGKPLPS